MTSILECVTEGPRIFLSSFKTRISPKKYTGNADQICKQIVKDCWNGRYFQTSTRNFPQFWTRDFGWCTQSLLKLGYKEQVHHTLRYALNNFKKKGRVTTTITPGGTPFDFPTYAVDSLPWLIHSIKVSHFPYDAFKSFLNKEIAFFCTRVINPNTGLVKPDEHFSSMKDLSVRKSSCYDNCMVGLLAENLKSMKLDNPFTNFNYPELIKRHFWNGHYFYDDLSKQNYVAGDANVFPFLFGLVKDVRMLSSAVAAVRHAGLDEPLPLKYTASRQGVRFVWQEQVALSNYESNAIWTHMGPLYIKIVQQLDSQLADTYLLRYKEYIERYQGFVEVYTSDGKTYRSWFYAADRGMLWAANYLTLY